jgi:hypothetical protein
MPITRLPTAAVATQSAIDSFRPRRSAIQPKTRPPNGRATNPTANTASVLSRAVPVSSPAKNCGAKKAEKVA